MPMSTQCKNIDIVTLMSNDCVLLMRKEMDSYRWLEGGSVCLSSMGDQYHVGTEFLATSSS